MDHDEAFRSQAAARYVAGELTPDEQRAFEEHFFDCPRCAAEVRLERTFIANLRAVARERAQADRRPALRELWSFLSRPGVAVSFAANFALLAALGYILLTEHRGGGSPHFMATFYAPGPARGEVHELAPGTTDMLVRFPSPGPQFSYSYQILNAESKPEAQGAIAPPAAGDTELSLEVSLRGRPALRWYLN
jgi:hypothetical protein